MRRYWDFDPSAQTRLASFPEYAETFRYHFERAVRRRLRSAQPVAVSVSGGLDSSAIFCMAETLRRKTPMQVQRVIGTSYTSADGTPSDEKAFLLEIEREYSIQIQRVPMAPPGFVNGSRRVVWHVEAPFLDEQWNTTHMFLIAVGQLGARVLLTGHWADQVLFDQAYLIDRVHQLAWRQVRDHLREFGRWLTDVDPRYFRRRFWRDLVKYHVPQTLMPVLRTLRPWTGRPWYTQELRERVGRYAPNGRVARGRFATAHARSLYEQARSNRHVLCMEWNSKVAAAHGLEIAFPFLDRDLLAFLMGIPGEIQTWHGVPKVLLREAMRGVLPETIALRNWKADFTHLVKEGMERDRPQLFQHLGPDGMAVKFGYVKEEVVKGEFRRLKGRIQGLTCETTRILSDLLGLELWLQVFSGDRLEPSEGSGTGEGRTNTIVSGGKT